MEFDNKIKIKIQKKKIGYLGKYYYLLNKIKELKKITKKFKEKYESESKNVYIRSYEKGYSNGYSEACKMMDLFLEGMLRTLSEKYKYKIIKSKDKQ